MSAATYARLSLELVFSGCFAAVFEEFHVQYALAADVSCSHIGGHIQEGGGRSRLSCAAQRPAALRAFQRYCHQVFRSQSIYFCIPLTSKQMQSDNKIKLCHKKTATFL